MRGQLSWEELPTKQDSRIAIYLKGMNPTDESTWSEQHQWLLDKSLTIYNCFLPRVLALKLQGGVGAGGIDGNDATGVTDVISFGPGTESAKSDGTGIEAA